MHVFYDNVLIYCFTRSQCGFLSEFTPKSFYEYQSCLLSEV